MKSMKRRRWLWICAVAVTVFAVIFAVAVWPRIRQRLSAAWVERHGGFVMWEYDGPDWLKPHLGDELKLYLSDVTDVSFYDGYAVSVTADEVIDQFAAFPRIANIYLPHPSCSPSDEHLERISRIPGLENLGFDARYVTDAGLASLSRCETLESLQILNGRHITHHGLRALLSGSFRPRWLEVIDTPITDAALTAFAKPNAADLYYVDFSGTEITDRGLAHLANCRNLQILRLKQTDVGDRGMLDWTVWPHLVELDLAETNTTDADLATIGRLAKLQELDVSHTEITDAGLKSLAGLTQLEELQLDGTQVSDVGLRHLAGLRNLEIVSVSNTQVTEEGLNFIIDLLYGWADGLRMMPTRHGRDRGNSYDGN